MSLVFEKLIRVFQSDHDEDGSIKKHTEKRKEIEDSTDTLQKRTEELLAEMIRKNECDATKHRRKNDQ